MYLLVKNDIFWKSLVNRMVCCGTYGRPFFRGSNRLGAPGLNITDAMIFYFYLLSDEITMKIFNEFN